MFTFQNGMIKTSVRKLVEFLLREGDIRSQGMVVADVEAMQAGSRIHRKIQKEQKITYQAEVPLKMSWSYDKYELVLEGRADGIDQAVIGAFTDNDQLNIDSYLNDSYEIQADPNQKIYYIDEIKGVYQNVLEFQQEKKLHLAQAKCYAAMYLIQHQLDRIGVQITYCNIETNMIKRFHHIYEKDVLETWFYGLIDSYKMWADIYVEARNVRQRSIDNLIFPFDYREGQKKLVAMVYHTIMNSQNVFFQAPTGIGKTISTVYPSLKTLAQEKSEKIYYLTAKTVTRTVAQDTLSLLHKDGLKIKAVTLTAKEKICCNDVFECDPSVCSMAEGHYDRINLAVYDLFDQEDIMTRDIILTYAKKHRVCPYHLSFEVASFADFVICDYNYVFDPHVNRNNLQTENILNKNILLVDEAHNLVERARTMYSADLSEADFRELRKVLPSSEKQLLKKLSSCKRQMTILKKRFKEEVNASDMEKDYLEMEDADSLYFPLFRFLDAFQEYLTDHQVFENRDAAVEYFFLMRHFLGILETMSEGYRVFGMWIKGGFMVRLFCIDPSAQLKDLIDQYRATIFFSATLLPMPYYRNLLYGEEAHAFGIPSPFDEKKRLVCIANDVTSRYTRRNEQEYRKINIYIEKSIERKKGNYMIFFPSYEMMEQVYLLFDHEKMDKITDVVIQKSMMDEKEKEEFLETFSEDRKKSLVGFCVLGSIFSEGIDLSGKRLVGVLIVGTGLPKVCMEREMIRDYFDIHDKKGYDYAYRYPGMNKVLQAAGRVIRSDDDIGIITLLDERFLWKENQYLLPDDWKEYYEVNLQSYDEVLNKFWKENLKYKNEKSIKNNEV